MRKENRSLVSLPKSGKEMTMRNALVRNSLVLAAVFAAAAGPAAAADTAAAVQKTLQADYDARDQAVARRDITATLSHYAPNFVGVSRTGQTHGLPEERADFLATFSLPARPGVTHSTIQKLTLAKAGTEADVSLHRLGSLSLTDPQTHASRTVILNGTYQDIWVKHAGVWLLAREQEISVTASLNGKPL